MKNRTAVYIDVNLLYKSRIITWLRAHVASEDGKIEGFPVTVSLDPPLTEDLTPGAERELREFCSIWSDSALPAGKVEFENRSFTGLGEMSVPVQVVFDDPSEVATWAGHLVEYQTSLSRLNQIRSCLPKLVDAAISCMDYLSAFEEDDFDKFVKVCQWICENPRSFCTIREIPVRGVDTTWFESHRLLLLAFLRDYLELDPSRRDLLQLGLVPPPATVSVVLLDSELRAAAGGMRYFSAPVSELAQLQLNPSQIIFVEDSETAIAIPELNGTMLVVTRNNLIGELAKIDYIAAARCIYLGSLDTRSFVVLNNLRVHLPRMQSLLLNEDFFVKNRDLWTWDDQLIGNISLALDPVEAALFNGLQMGAYGAGNPRLPLNRVPLATIFRTLGIREDLLPTRPPQTTAPINVAVSPRGAEISLDELAAAADKPADEAPGDDPVPTPAPAVDRFRVIREEEEGEEDADLISSNNPVRN